MLLFMCLSPHNKNALLHQRQMFKLNKLICIRDVYFFLSKLTKVNWMGSLKVDLHTRASNGTINEEIDETHV